MRVLIVDDEVSNIEMISQEIDWNGLHIDDVASAEDGEEAKELILKYYPDILLCDVEMPRVNGLELIQWVKENKIDMEIVILSCHDKFSYAQTAMYYGVREYLIKPFRMEELYISLSKAVFAARQKKEDKSEGRIYLEQGLLQRLYSNEVICKRSLHELLEYGRSSLNVDADYRMLYVGVNRSDFIAYNYSEGEFVFILENIATELLGFDVSGARSIRSIKEPFYYLIYFLEDAKEDIKEKCDELLKISNEYLKMPLYCCLTEKDSLINVVSQRAQVEEYYLNKLKIGSSSFYVLGEGETGREKTEMKMDESMLLSILRQERFAEFTRYVREQMMSLEKEGMLNLTTMQKMEHIVSHVMYRLCDERGIPVLDIFKEETVFKLQKEASFGIPSMLKYISYTIACIQKEQKVSKDDYGIVDQAKKYIAKHYAEDIGRTDIADECHVSPGYLSKVFSERVGMNMREYINQYRVNESKRLLRIPEKSIGLAAMEVGFENLSYFSTIFKKETGETPAEWRKRIFL